MTTTPKNPLIISNVIVVKHINIDRAYINIELVARVIKMNVIQIL